MTRQCCTRVLSASGRADDWKGKLSSVHLSSGHQLLARKIISAVAISYASNKKCIVREHPSKS